MLVNLIAAEGIFAAVFATAIAFTWPTPPWPTITIAGIVTMVVAPMAFYPFSKTLWLAVDLIFRPVRRGTTSEEADPSRSPPRDEHR